VNEPSTRVSLQKTYNQILSDLLASKQLLPISPLYTSRPSKVAAYAALARVYLSMEDYDNAFKNADSCLTLNNTLIDYSTLNPGSSTPIAIFNKETIFYARMASAAILPQSNGVGIVDSSL